MRQCIGCYLTGQIDGHGNLHRNHFIVTCNDRRVIDIIGRVKLDGRVVIEELIQFFGTDGAGGHHFAIIESFYSVGNHPSGKQMHYIIGHIFSMDTQIIFIRQRQQGGLMGGAQTNLHGGAVFDEMGNQAPDVVGGRQLRGFTDGQ